jgi:hypothetical protein
VDQGARSANYAVVLQVEPLQVELTERRTLLDDSELVLTQWVRRYVYEHGLFVGDTLLVTQMPNNDFLVSDVVSSNRIEEGIDHPSGDLVSFTSRNGHIVERIPRLDNDGTVIGEIAVYGPGQLRSDGSPT